MTIEQKLVILEWLVAQKSPVDAMQGCRVAHVDWHKVSDYLEELVRKGLARTTGQTDGMHKYVLAGR